jgi:hypothetical protein
MRKIGMFAARATIASIRADGEGRCRAAAPQGLVRRPHRGDLAPLRDLLVVNTTAVIASNSCAGLGQLIFQSILQLNRAGIAVPLPPRRTSMRINPLGRRPARRAVNAVGGVGNCINMFSLTQIFRFPFLTLVTMRGEWGEFNPLTGADGIRAPPRRPQHR